MPWIPRRMLCSCCRVYTEEVQCELKHGGPEEKPGEPGCEGLLAMGKSVCKGMEAWDWWEVEYVRSWDWRGRMDQMETGLYPMLRGLDLSCWCLLKFLKPTWILERPTWEHCGSWVWRGKLQGDQWGNYRVNQMRNNYREWWSNWKDILEVESREFGDWWDFGVKEKEDLKMTAISLVWATRLRVILYTQEALYNGWQKLNYY